jgi:hypothetical protein
MHERSLLQVVDSLLLPAVGRHCDHMACTVKDASILLTVLLLAGLLCRVRSDHRIAAACDLSSHVLLPPGT